MLPSPQPVLLIDVGGVLLLHNPDILMPITAKYGGPATFDDFQRAHYSCHHESRPAHGPGQDYFDLFPEHAGIPAERREAFDAEYRAAHRTRNLCNWPDPAAKASLQAIVDAGVPVAVVSQADGTIEAMLHEAQMCQVGEGAGVPVDTILDSEVVGFNKPDPRFFQLALDRLGARPDQAIHVGDTVRADVRGAQAAGIRALHYDPYGHCDDKPGTHEHVRSMAEVMPYLDMPIEANHP